MRAKLLSGISLILLSSILFFTSCDKDDADPINSNKIIGFWELDDINLDVKMNGVSLEQFIEDELGITGAIAQGMIDEFMEEMAMEDELPNTINIKDDGTYNVTFNDSSTDDGVWELSGDILIIDPDTVWEMQLVINSLTNTRLTVHFTDSQQEDITEDGTDELIESIVTMYYVK